MNFLAKTITSLESRLDSVLLGEDQGKLPSEATARATVKDGKGGKVGQLEMAGDPPPPSIPRTGTPKLSLQERLAAATARSASPSLGLPGGRSLAGSARSSMDKNRGSIDQPGVGDVAGVTKGQPTTALEDKKEDKNMEDKKEEIVQAVEGPTTSATATATTENGDLSSAKTIEITPPQQLISPAIETGNSESKPIVPEESHPNTERLPVISGTTANVSQTLLEPSEYENIIAQLRADLEICEVRRQEELHTSSERIDSLESKVKYLARESAEAAKRRATSSPAGGLEKQLAEKEERIALLLEEGERLSKLELKNMTIIKRLRMKVTEEEKASVEAKKKLEKAEKELADCKEKLKKAAETEKRLNERVRVLGRFENEAESLRKDKSDKDTLILDLKAQLSLATSRAEEAESKAQTEALIAEKARSRELREQLEKVQTEAALMEERLRSEITDLKSKLERGAERAKMTEAELRSEVSVMETTVEVLRARAEEVSSGAAGDAHAKLLRQVETLQTQYAIASENWQGIEGSLLARVAAVERERDELAKTEADVRRKARDFNLKAKRAEMDLDSAHTRIKELEEDMLTHKQRAEALQKQVSELQFSLKEARQGLERAREEFGRELFQKLEESRSKWLEESAATMMRPTSPSITGTPRMSSRSIGRSPNMSIDGYSTFSPPLHHQRDVSMSGLTEPNSGNNGTRRGRTSFGTPNRQDSNLSSLSLPQIAVGGSAASVIEDDDGDEDYFGENLPVQGNSNGAGTGAPTVVSGIDGPFYSPSPSSPQARTFAPSHHAQDLVSVSTVAAGPSVQLVERMSAAVRRLETEMAASRDELARMIAQRDEARQEIVDLMREVEMKREVEKRVEALEMEKVELEGKFHAALDELGEKLEKVDELEDQMKDLKMMYKDLVMKTSGG